MKKIDEIKISLKNTIKEIYEQHDKSTDKYNFLHEIEELIKELRKKKD